MQNNPKDLHILSVDGGGSRGLMESIMLKHIMNLSTVMVRSPEKILKKIHPNIDHKGIKSLIEDVDKPIHPVDAFQYIVGTSTGALISFGLVGGNLDKDPERGIPERSPMTVEEVINYYRETIPILFVKANPKKGIWSSFKDGTMNFLANRFSDIPLFSPYTQKPMEDAIMKKFDDGENRAMTNDIIYRSDDNTCYAGAVARQFNENITKPDKCRIFDSRSNPPQFVYEVLRGTSDAPIYFEVPSKIGFGNFIDGGVGGNCPIGQAMPRVESIWPNSSVKSVLSLAPPPPQSKKEKIEEMGSVGDKTFSMLEYLISEITNGEATYETVKDQYQFNKEKKVLFMRSKPTSEKSSIFPIDERDIEKMTNAMEEELECNFEYLLNIIVDATVIAVRMIKKEDSKYSRNHRKMLLDMVRSLISMLKCEASMYILEEIKEEFTGDEFYCRYLELRGDIHQKCNSFNESKKRYEEAIEHLVEKKDVHIKRARIYEKLATNAVFCYKLRESKEASLDEAKDYFQKAIDSSVASKSKDKKLEKARIPARSYIGLAYCHIENEEYKNVDECSLKAEEYLNSAEDCSKNHSNNAENLIIRCKLNWIRGKILQVESKYQKAAEKYKEAENCLDKIDAGSLWKLQNQILINKTEIIQNLHGLPGKWTLPPVGTSGPIYSEEEFLRADTWPGSKVKLVRFDAPDSGWKLEKNWVSANKWVRINKETEQEWYRSKNDFNGYFRLESLHNGKFLFGDSAKTLTMQDGSEQQENHIEREELEAKIRNSKGECFEKLGKYEQACEEYKASMELNGDLECTTAANSITLYNMGKLYFKMAKNPKEMEGLCDEAKKYLYKARALQNLFYEEKKTSWINLQKAKTARLIGLVYEEDKFLLKAEEFVTEACNIVDECEIAKEETKVEFKADLKRIKKEIHDENEKEQPRKKKNCKGFFHSVSMFQK